MDKGQKMRMRSLGKSIGEILVLGFLYVVWVLATGIYIPCPVRFVTGYKCPGCGISHYCMALLKGDVAGAYQENPFVFVVMPFLLMYGAYRGYRHVRYDDERFRAWEIVAMAIMVVAAMVFGIMRNR